MRDRPLIWYSHIFINFDNINVACYATRYSFRSNGKKGRNDQVTLPNDVCRTGKLAA